MMVKANQRITNKIQLKLVKKMIVSGFICDKTKPNSNEKKKNIIQYHFVQWQKNNPKKPLIVFNFSSKIVKFMIFNKVMERK